jgi:predicted enzyme related to lactoylglutathione lyase
MSFQARGGARFAHVNVVARDWRRLACFYEHVFGCVPVPPERNLEGEWLDRATGIARAHALGTHLRLPGLGDGGPTLEIFEYIPGSERVRERLDSPGFAHVAFAVEDVETTAQRLVTAGGQLLGQRVEREIPGAGRIDFQYAADPEGNAIEIQRWTAVRTDRRTD